MLDIENASLGYIFYWPDYQKYEELPEFNKHSFYTCDSTNQMVVIEKDWLDAAIKREQDKQYAGFWDV